MKDSPITADVKYRKLVFAMSRDTWRIFSIFALVTGAAFTELSFSLFTLSQQFRFCMTVLCISSLVGIFVFARTQEKHSHTFAGMADSTRVQLALFLSVFLLGGVIGIWLGLRWAGILLWSASIGAARYLGHDYANAYSSD